MVIVTPRLMTVILSFSAKAEKCVGELNQWRLTAGTMQSEIAAQKAKLEESPMLNTSARVKPSAGEFRQAREPLRRCR